MEVDQPMSGQDIPATGELTPDERRLNLLLKVVAVITWLAFAAAVMPQQWIVEISEWLGFDPFPYSPLTFYLARHLSLLYGFLGAGLWVITTDFHRYRKLISYLAIGTIAIGLGQLIIDLQAGMPLWWTLGESISTMFGGGLIWWLDRRSLSN